MPPQKRRSAPVRSPGFLELTVRARTVRTSKLASEDAGLILSWKSSQAVLRNGRFPEASERLAEGAGDDWPALFFVCDVPLVVDSGDDS